MENHINEAIAVIVTSIIGTIIRFFEKKKINKEITDSNHFKK